MFVRLYLLLLMGLGLGAGRALAQAAGPVPASLGALPTVAPAGQTVVRALPDFLAVAYGSSPLLNDLRNQVAQNHLDSLRRKAQNGVQVAGIGAAVATPVITNGSGEQVLGYDQAVSNGGNYAGFGQATKPLLNRFQLQTDYRILGSQGLVLRNQGRLSQLDLRRSVTDQFLTAYVAQLQLEFSRTLLAQLRRQDGQLRQLVNAGIFKQTQYLSFYLSVRTQEVSVEQNRLAYRRELGTLRYLSGVADTALVALVPPPAPARRPLAGLASITQRRYTLDSLRYLLDRQAVDASYRPKLSAVLDAGIQAAQPGLLALGHSTGFGAGFLVALPIFDGHQRQLQYQRIELGEQSRQGYRQFLTVQRQQQYDQLRGLIQASEALAGRIREQLRVADALVTAYQQQLATGEVLILDYLNLVTSYRALQFSLTQAETDRLRSEYALDYLGD